MIQPDIAERFRERWFPPMRDQVVNYLKNGCLVQGEKFSACTRRCIRLPIHSARSNESFGQVDS